MFHFFYVWVILGKVVQFQVERSFRGGFSVQHGGLLFDCQDNRKQYLMFFNYIVIEQCNYLHKPHQSTVSLSTPIDLGAEWKQSPVNTRGKVG